MKEGPIAGVRVEHSGRSLATYAPAFRLARGASVESVRPRDGGSLSTSYRPILESLMHVGPPTGGASLRSVRTPISSALVRLDAMAGRTASMAFFCTLVYWLANWPRSAPLRESNEPIEVKQALAWLCPEARAVLDGVPGGFASLLQTW